MSSLIPFLLSHLTSVVSTIPVNSTSRTLSLFIYFLSAHCHPGPDNHHCFSSPVFYLISCFSLCPLQFVLNPGDTPQIMPISAQESPYVSSFSLRMKAHVFPLICRACLIWVYGYFLYMFSRGLISNTTLS